MQSADKRTVVAIGPANTCGQGSAWAGAIREHLRVDAFSFAADDRIASRLARVRQFDPPAERLQPHFRLTTRRWANWRTRRILRPATHMAIESFHPILGLRWKDDLADELGEIRESWPRLALIAHGSDIRSPDRHMDRVTSSYFRQAPPRELAAMRRVTSRNAEVACDFDGPMFVSTPDLILDLPRAKWLPVVTDCDSWSCPVPALRRKRPAVLFMPSRSWVKGAHHIQPVLSELAARGRIELVGPGKPVDHTRMRRLVHDSDIVIDQIQGGFYGLAAVEGMAAGRLVVGFVDSFVREHVPDEIPIVDAAPSTFADVIHQIIDDPLSYDDTAHAGVQFARRWHDGRVSAMALEPFVRS